MKNPLYLTAAERGVLEALPGDPAKDCEVREEVLTFEDSDEKLAVRMRNLHLNDPRLKELQDQAATKTYTPEEMAKLANELDLSTLSEEDLMELCFAWGPSVFTKMIAALLPQATTEEALEALAQFAGLRHGLLISLSPNPLQ